MNALTVDTLGKAYLTYRSEWHRFARWFGWPIRPVKEHWVLENVSFSIAPGEALGIIGQNGAGKSTLLKLIAGTVRPSAGSVVRKGRIAAILELGLGFNPDLTGRENVIHAAGLMGASPAQIGEALPEIEAFAEIDAYFNQAVRTYSSGMQARLAFSVATAFRPDILIVDEVLAVGDAYFIHKSANRIKEFQRLGTSLIVVAHDRAAIQTLCDRALLLEKGKMILEGLPDQVLDHYNALIAAREAGRIVQIALPEGRVQTLSGSGDARVEALSLCDEFGQPLEEVRVGQMLRLKVTIRLHENLDELVFGYLIKDRLGNEIYGTNTQHAKIPFDHRKKGELIRMEIDFLANLGVGSYSVSTALHTGETHVAQNYEWRDLALVFKVINPEQTPFIGVNWLPPTIRMVS